MKKITITIVMAMLCLIFKVNAQVAATKQLRVGDKVPASFWLQEHEVYHAGKVTKETFAAYKDKLIILDFWATWCGSCLAKFPLMEDFQAKYADQLKVMLVNCVGTQDEPEGIVARLEGKKAPFITYTLPTIQGDTALLSLFPHKVIPHYIWIMEGEVRAITTAEFIDEGNVSRILERVRVIKEKSRLLKEQAAAEKKKSETKTKN